MYELVAHTPDFAQAYFKERGIPRYFCIMRREGAPTVVLVKEEAVRRGIMKRQLLYSAETFSTIQELFDALACRRKSFAAPHDG